MEQVRYCTLSTLRYCVCGMKQDCLFHFKVDIEVSVLYSVCVVGSRLVRQVDSCNKTFGGELYDMFCVPNATLIGEGYNKSTLTPDDYECDEYFLAHEAHSVQGIKGLSSGIFLANIKNKYHEGGDAISLNETSEPEYNLGGQPKMGYITTDIYTTFTILVGIFFPSCTGKEIHTVSC